MKRLLPLLMLALVPLFTGCALWGTKYEYRVTPKIFRLEDLLEDLDRAKNPEAAKEPVKAAAPKSLAGKYLLKVNTLSGGDNYMAGNCDESALVDVDKDRKIIDVKQFPSSAKTCGNEDSLKATFWGKTLPAALLAGGQVGGSAVLGMSFPKPVGDRINVTGVEGGIKNENEQEQKAEGGSGGKSVVEKGAVANTTNNNLTANPTAYGGSGGKAEAEIKNSGNSSSFSNSKSDGGKVIGSGNSTNYNSSGSYSNSDSSAANYNSNYNNASSSSSNKNISPVDVDVKVQPGQSGGKHGGHGWD